MAVVLRELRAADRGGIERILRRVGVFAEAEIAVALELVDIGLGRLPGDGYRFLVAAEGDDVAAYAWLSVEFHDHDTRLSGNVTAKRIHDSLLLRTLAIRRLSLSQPERLRKSLEDHIQLVKAYESNDAILAGAILRANHSAALAAVERYHRINGSLRPTAVDGP